MGETKIEWADFTFNAWVGCTKVSEACQFCYAEGWSKRTGGPTWGPGGDRRRTTDNYWRQPLKWDREAAAARVKRFVFCCSLADVFDDHHSIPSAWRAQLFDLIGSTPNLVWLLLTKRPENIAKMLPPDWGTGYENVWLGTTVENQERAEERVPHLIRVPAARHFLSMEPLLGPVDLTTLRMPGTERTLDGISGLDSKGVSLLSDDSLWAIDWVITGGESGPKARPSHPDWFRSLRDTCDKYGVAFHFKQWGEWTPGVNVDRQSGIVPSADWWGTSWSFGTEDLARDDGHIDDEPDLYRVGKKAAGRLLDGRTHDDRPQP